MIKKGTQVKWSWGDGNAEGEVIEIFKSKITKTIDGNEVTRDASEDCPAYLIKQDDGQKVIKSKTEVTRTN